ncbi:hypothetical protein BD309DRAFT_1084951 [Dichomitus squalens]|nr:hypothetical protein BD309DRAFT_1084951 [Dichomitus squalens]
MAPSFLVVTAPTDSLLNVLIAYTVNTCVLTSAINALALGFLIAFPTNMIYFGILTPATRSYTMAVLAVLNSRTSIAEWYKKRAIDFGTSGLGHNSVAAGAFEKGSDVQMQEGAVGSPMVYTGPIAFADINSRSGRTSYDTSSGLTSQRTDEDGQ